MDKVACNLFLFDNKAVEKNKQQAIRLIDLLKEAYDLE